MVELLLKGGSSVNALDNSGQTPLFLAASYGYRNIVKRLVLYGGDGSVVDKYGSTAADMTDDTAIKDLLTLPTLSIAAASADPDVVRELLIRGHDPNAQYNLDTTPLCIACSEGNCGAVKVLLANGAKGMYHHHHHPYSCAVDTPGYKKRTALHEAAVQGHIDCVFALLEAGADINALDENGRTPLALSYMLGHKMVVELLISAGARKDVIDVFGAMASELASSPNTPMRPKVPLLDLSSPSPPPGTKKPSSHLDPIFELE